MNDKKSFKFDFIKKDKKYSYSFSLPIIYKNVNQLCNEVLFFFSCFGYNVDDKKLLSLL